MHKSGIEMKEYANKVKHLCIGGPFDGQLKEADPDQREFYFVRTIYSEEERSIGVERSRYRRMENFAFVDHMRTVHDYNVCYHEELMEHQAFDRLIQGYIESDERLEPSRDTVSNFQQQGNSREYP